MKIPGIVVAALRGGSGKTVISLGIISAWKKLGKRVAPFKKGPDYIDAGWLALAAGRPCHNLDTFLIEKKHILQSFRSHTGKGDIALIEGNRGLYDGIDAKGSTSTAELAKLLRTPVLLCIDCTKATRTIAAAVLGCIRFDPEVNIKGIILNRIAGARHETIIRESIETHCGTPVLGAVPKLGKQNFPERHMGLIPTPEHSWAKESIAAAAEVAERYLDVESIYDLALDASGLPAFNTQQEIFDTGTRQDAGTGVKKRPKKPRIGIIRDPAFNFYYPENIEALVKAGAEVVFINALEANTIPPVDALYIGGGFPETHAKKLAENIRFRMELKALVEDGLPVYAECGGLMYLSEALEIEERSYPMAGVLPIVFGFSKKPQGHGYTIVAVEGKNPYFSRGVEIRGHEFHYSKVLSWRGEDSDLVFGMKRGTGFMNKKDGICYKNVLATFTHLHALGTPSWAEAMVRNASS